MHNTEVLVHRICGTYVWYESE